MKIHPVVPCR